MAMSELAAFGAMITDPDFVSKLEDTSSVEELKSVLSQAGISLEAFDPDSEEGELSISDLDEVSGGVSRRKLIIVLKGVYKMIRAYNPRAVNSDTRFGKSCRVLLQAYYDIYKHGDPTHSYTEEQIQGAARTLGIYI